MTLEEVYKPENGSIKPGTYRWKNQNGWVEIENGEMMLDGVFIQEQLEFFIKVVNSENQ